MGWKGPYYYQSIRHGNRVESRYGGHGLVAALMAYCDADERAERAAALADRQAAALAERLDFQECRQRVARVDDLVALGLTALDFHRPHRAMWRRINVAPRMKTPPSSTVTRRIGTLCRRLKKHDDPEAFDELRELATAWPDQVVEAILTAPLPGVVEKIYRRHVCGDREQVGDELIELGMATDLQTQREALLAGSDNPAVRLAVELAIHRYLDLWMTEERAAGNPWGTTPALDKRRNWAQRRFLSALRAVETIRRLTRSEVPLLTAVLVKHVPPTPPVLELEMSHSRNGNGRQLQLGHQSDSQRVQNGSAPATRRSR